MSKHVLTFLLIYVNIFIVIIKADYTGEISGKSVTVLVEEKMENVLSLISSELDNSTLVAKNHIEDFNAKSQLVVYESQEALFFKDGQALDLFGPGRHTLNSDNVPLLKKMFSALFGGKTPFPCEVFFINKVCVLDLLWGTDTPIVIEDPKYGLIVNVRANGQAGISVYDSRRFVVKVVGQLPEFKVDSVRRSIKGMLMSAIKETIAKVIVEQGISVLEITTKLSAISNAVTEKINQRLADIGVSVNHFAINSILGDDSDIAKLREAKAKRMEVMNEAEAEAFKMTLMSEARAKARAIEGYTYQDERRFDVLEGAAKNEGGASTFMSMGVGLGVGAGLGRDIGNMYNSSAPVTSVGQPTQAVRTCAKCQTQIAAGAKFCFGCGSPVEQPTQFFCPQCGNKCPEGAIFCSSCGNKIR